MNIYIVSGEEVILVPINPEELEIKAPSNNRTEKVVNLGEVNILDGRNLREFTLSSFCSRSDKMISWLEKKQRTGTPVRFIIEELKVNILCAIEDFTKTFKAGEEKEVYYEIEFKQYRDYSPKHYILEETKKTSTKTTTKRDTTSKPTNSGTYIVKTGDCLWSIAKKLCGNGSRWNEMYDINKDVIGKNPNLIYPNQKLKIPEKWVKK